MTAAVRQIDEQILPQNIEAEQALLGAILVNNEAFHRVSDLIGAEDFYESSHARVWDACASLIRSGRAATPVTLSGVFAPEWRAGTLNGPQYIARLAADAVSVIGAPDYAGVVRDLAIRRKLIALARDALAAAYDAPIDYSPAELIQNVETALFDLEGDATAPGQGRGLVTYAEAVTQAVDSAARAYQADGKATGVTWGLSDMDRITTGLQPGDLTILAGRPSMGKSAVGLSVAMAASQWIPPDAERPIGVLVVSPEMTAKNLAERSLSAYLARTGRRVEYSRFRSGRFSPEDFDAISEVARASESLPLVIDEAAGRTVGGVVASSRRAALRFKRLGTRLGLIVVDYLQLLIAEDRYRGRRVDEVGEISGALKRLAKSEGVPVLALSQLSRQVENRDDKRPLMSDLRDSGSIEQDADNIVFAYRAEYYLRNREPCSGSDAHIKWQMEMDDCHGRMDLIIGKQRNGPVSTITVNFDAGTNTVSDRRDDDLPQREMF